jgi:hypothetical protein
MKLGQVAVTAVSIAAGAVVACNANQSASASTSKEATSRLQVSSHVSSLVSVEDVGVTIRTENYPRPPSSDATYYIYEKDGKVICTKLAVCDKYGNCKNEYRAGTYKAEQDAEVGQAYGSTQPEPIARDKLSKHVCLAKYVKDLP